MNLEEFTRLKKQAASLERQAAESEGALSQLLTQLDSEFGMKSAQEGEKLLRRLEAEAEQTERASTKAAEEYKEKWGNKLE